MVRRISGLLLWLVFAGQPASAMDLESALASATRAHRVPGMAALTIKNCKAGREAVFGVRAAGSSDPVRKGDAWHIGSNAKAMTATLIARLVEAGTLSWDTPLSELLPEDRGTMRPEYRDITLKELLSHRAGLPDHIGIDALIKTYDDPRPAIEQRKDYVRRALQDPPVGPARSKPSYSNSGYVIAGAIAERFTKLPFEELVRRNIFNPLKLTSAAFGPTATGQPLGHSDGKALVGPRADNPPVISPAGQIHLSMRDWAGFAVDQMRGERGEGVLLDRQSYRFLHQVQGNSAVALGWGLRSVPANGPRLLGHSGSNMKWYATILIEPDRCDGILVAANAGSDDAQAAVARLINDYLASKGIPQVEAPPERPKKEARDDPSPRPERFR